MVALAPGTDLDLALAVCPLHKSSLSVTQTCVTAPSLPENEMKCSDTVLIVISRTPKPKANTRKTGGGGGVLQSSLSAYTAA